MVLEPRDDTLPISCEGCRITHGNLAGPNRRLGTAGRRSAYPVDRSLALNAEAVFAAVDAQTRIDLQQELLQLIWERTRKTVVFVTHSGDEALLPVRPRVRTLRPPSARAGRPSRSASHGRATPRRLLEGGPSYRALHRRIWALLRAPA